MANRSIVRHETAEFLRRHAFVVAVVVALAVLAACTGTKRPDALETSAAKGGLIGDEPATDGRTTGPPPATGTAGPDTGANPPATGDALPDTSLPTGTTPKTAAGGGGGEPATASPTAIFSARDDRVGLTDATMKLCMHASLQLGAVFNNTEDDFRVYWQMVNDAGGVQGRKIDITFTDDQYTPQGGAQAAQQCKAAGAFLMAGGVGFDTVPAVRQFAEQNDMLYLSSFATERDIAGYQRSFSFVPSIERVGYVTGQFAAKTFAGKKVGIVWRNSPNWQGGRDQFARAIGERGGKVVADVPVEKDQGDYTNAILTLRNAGAQVVLGWINVLEFTQFAKQASAQGYRPTYITAGFNLVTDTLGHEIDGTVGPAAYAMWITPPYPPDPNSPWQPEVDRMLAAFAKYRPSKNGKVNDVDWQVWLYFRQLHRLLDDCGRDCSRNRIAGMFHAGYRADVPPACPIDFARGGGRLGGFAIDIFKAVPNGAGARWSGVAHCQERF